MSALGFIKGLLGLNDSDEVEEGGLDILAELLAEREATLALDAEYGQPTTNTLGEPTAVFPATLFHDGEEYGAHVKEFTLPDNGLDDTEAPLTQFVADAHGISPEEADFSDLAAIEGMSADARLTEEGDLVLDAPQAEIEVENTEDN